MAISDIELSFPRFTKDPIHHLTFQSPALCGRGNVLFFIPPEHADKRGLPFVVLLHGVLGSHWSWAYNGGAHIVSQGLIDSGDLPPHVLVMPSDGMVGRGSGYVKNGEADCERWIVEDVPAAAREVIPAITESSQGFIAGFSMGGFGALRLGAKYPELWHGIGGHSSITHFDQMKQFIEIDSPQFADLIPEDKSVLFWMKAHRDRLPPVRFDCGRDDRLFAYNEKLHEELTEEAIPHTYCEYPGAHSWDYWHEHLADTLRFFAPHMEIR